MALDASSTEAQTLVDRTLADGFRWMTFPARLERAFVQDMGPQRAIKLTLAALNGLLVFGGMLIGDALMKPRDLPLAIGLRLGAFTLLVLTMLLALRRWRHPAVNEWAVPAVSMVAGCITGYLACTGSNPLAYTKLVELLVVVTYATVFSRFWPMVALGLGAAAVHAVVILNVADALSSLKLGTTLLLVTTVSFAWYACYVRERNDRMSYLLDVREQGLRQSLKANNERLATAARTDALTGAANRRAFDEFLTQSWQRCQAEGKALALLMVDVDHFKAYNDRYGHQAGDHCLQTVAQAIGHGLRRPVDLLARWGGEEFAVLLTDANAASATPVAERIRQAVEACALPHAGSSCATVVTVSIGLATMRPGDGDQPAALLRMADQRLYRAKTEGRNRIGADDGPVLTASSHKGALA